MRAIEQHHTWTAEPRLPETRKDSRPIKIDRTSQNSSLTITIQTIFFTRVLAEISTPEGCSFLVIAVHLSNESDLPYVFHTEMTAIYLRQPNPYEKAMRSIYSFVNEHEGVKESNTCRYEPLTSKIEQGLREVEIIAAKGIRKGVIVYTVPQEARNYIFGYEDQEISVKIPLLLST
jgi:hypothetical protein